MISHDPNYAIKIVLADDNPADQDITRRVFGSQANVCNLNILSDGRQALAYLNSTRHDDVSRKKELPDRILMDINMPSLSGIVAARVNRDQTDASRALPGASL